MVLKIQRRRICGDESVHLLLYLFHILVIAAFQLHPKTGIAIVVGNKMADIVGTVAALVGNQTLRHRPGAVGYAEIRFVSLHQFTIDGFHNIGKGVRLADDTRISQSGL